MPGMEPHDQYESSAVLRYRRRRTRRQRYAYRRGLAALLLAGLGAGLYFGGRAALGWLSTPQAPPSGGTAAPLGQTAALGFTPQEHLPAPDLDGDGRPEQIALGPVENAMRKVALTTGGSGKSEKAVGPVLEVLAFPLEVRDLPRAKGLLVLRGALPSLGQPTTEDVKGQKATVAAGGEPDLKAWRLDGKQGLVAVDYYALAAPLNPPAPDSILVDKYLNVLWHYQESQLAATYRVTTGRHLEGPAPTAANQAVNFITPVGRYTIANKSKGLYYGPLKLAADDPKNPLGTRWMGFAVFPGDSGTVWGIHGTIEPDKIGHWASDGCIRLAKADVEALYEKVTPGKTILEIIDSSR